MIRVASLAWLLWALSFRKPPKHAICFYFIRRPVKIVKAIELGTLKISLRGAYVPRAVQRWSMVYAY